jgi:hypothetical protein
VRRAPRGRSFLLRSFLVGFLVGFLASCTGRVGASQAGQGGSTGLGTGGTGNVQCPSGKTKCGAACKDLTSDQQNCGACGSACGAGEVCQAGQWASRSDCVVERGNGIACIVRGALS